jgi:hypothetical protein
VILIEAVIVPVALFSAARSTWSPCGLSMLSSITPFGERARGHRYCVTAAWYVAGGLAGGVTLGALAALVAWGVAASGASATDRLATGAALALGAAALDAGWLGSVLPLLRRQVDDRWLSRYRAWFYAFGFGWQIGVGLATYLMTTGVILLFALGALTGRPLAALAAGGLFGLARGLTVYATAGASTPAALRRVHAALDRHGRPAGAATACVLAATGVVLAAAAALPARWPWMAGGWPLAGLGLVVAAVGVAVWVVRRPAPGVALAPGVAPGVALAPAAAPAPGVASAPPGRMLSPS